MTIRLSQAIQLGATAISLAPCFVRSCAIGAALEANGRDLYRGDSANYSQFLDDYPWLQNVLAKCPFCGEGTFSNYGIVTHLFDNHVMVEETKKMPGAFALAHYKPITLEQMCDFLESLDPTPKEEQTDDRNAARLDAQIESGGGSEGASQEAALPLSHSVDGGIGGLDTHSQVLPMAHPQDLVTV